MPLGLSTKRGATGLPHFLFYAGLRPTSRSLWASFRPFSQRSLHYRSAACFRPRLSLAFAFGKAPTGRTLVDAAKCPLGLALIGVRFTTVHALVKAHTCGPLTATRLCALRLAFIVVHFATAHALVKAHTCGSLTATRLCALRTRFPPVHFPPVHSLPVPHRGQVSEPLYLAPFHGAKANANGIAMPLDPGKGRRICGAKKDASSSPLATFYVARERVQGESPGGGAEAKPPHPKEMR